MNRDDKLDEILGMAQSVTNVFRNRQTRNANSTFVQYLFEELERMSEDIAREKRKQILLLLFNEK